ncbi:CBM35 domain-containing protein, partial [Streptomyces phytophilus]|uniref:CBM35 domain-containing protein n=1 Tax=Streptomyces phytophilus TaxID=722715 RepID=UPI0028682715
VVIAIVAAVLFSGDGEGSDVGGGDAESVAPSPDGKGDDDGPKNGDDKPAKDPIDPPSEDGTKLELAGGAVVGSDTNVSEDGSYVHGMENEGASATWKPEVDAAGEYTLFVDYSVPGKDAELTLTVNGDGRSVNMENFAKAKKNDWQAGWTRTYQWINLDEGANEITLSCESGNKDCQTAISQVELKKGQVTS